MTLTRVWMAGVGVAAFVVAIVGAQEKAPLPQERVQIQKPTVDKAAGKVTMPAAFWNQHLADWVEVGLCGRPSDFLHETLLCVMTTREVLEGALREAGFRDADAWAPSVREFARVRGDRFVVLLEYTDGGKQETYSLDELLAFQGWNVAAGPYGFMFRGDPERATKPATRPAPIFGAGEGGEEDDRVKILRDDPQIALIFKGLQSASQSFADHPLAYDDWIFPMMNFGRNYKAMPAKVYDSNGQLPVTVTFQKVTEEELLRTQARVWHDDAFRQYILKQVPVAQQIDKDKAALLALMPAVNAARAKIGGAGVAEQDVLGQAGVLSAQIERDYATLDAAWGTWAADHAAVEIDDPKLQAAMKDEAARWKRHVTLEAQAAARRAEADAAAIEAGRLSRQATTEETRRQLHILNGKELVARSEAQVAENTEPTAYWAAERARLDANDPRVDWVQEVGLHVEQTAARQRMADAGLAYGRGLEAGKGEAELGPLAAAYARAVIDERVLDLRLQLSGLNFEIEKRKAFDNDPDLPRLQARKDRVERDLAAAQAATRPAGAGGQ